MANEATSSASMASHEAGEVASKEAGQNKASLSRPAGLPASLPDNDADAAPHSRSLSSGSSLDSPLLVPLVLLFAAYHVYLYPDRGVAVLLLLGALSTFGPTAQPMYRLLAETLENVTLRASSSEKLRDLAMRQMRAALSDPVVKRNFTDSCRDSMLESLQDERTQATMVSCTTQACLAATLDASKDEGLQSTLNTAMRSGVKEALSDPTVAGAFFNVVKEGLRDPKMHQAALKGAVTAANPLKDLTVPSLPGSLTLTSLTSHTNPITNAHKAVSSTLKDAIVDAEAKSLATASGLSRAPPPMLPGAKSPPQEPTRKSSDSSVDPFADPLEAFIAHGRQAS